jgi:hypothetical protein
MAQGLAITDENGRTFFDTSKTTWNFVAYLVAPADQTSSWIVSDIDYFSEITITRSYLNVLYGGQETFIPITAGSVIFENNVAKKILFYTFIRPWEYTDSGVAIPEYLLDYYE